MQATNLMVPFNAIVHSLRTKKPRLMITVALHLGKVYYVLKQSLYHIIGIRLIL